jgi:hypothetical protein
VISFLGIQSLSPPFGHITYHNLLEKNALIPFLLKNRNLYKKCESLFNRIIGKLDLTDFITFYFGLEGDNIIPIACSTLPDENFPLWHMRVSGIPISSILINNFELPPITVEQLAFKVPIYSYNSIKVPKIPQELADRRNIEGVISHPSFPLCTLWGASSSLSDLDHIKRQKIDDIRYILSSRY